MNLFLYETNPVPEGFQWWQPRLDNLTRVIILSVELSICCGSVSLWWLSIRIRLHFDADRIQIFTLMRIRILFFIKVMWICDYPLRLHFDPTSLALHGLVSIAPKFWLWYGSVSRSSFSLGCGSRIPKWCDADPCFVRLKMKVCSVVRKVSEVKNDFLVAAFLHSLICLSQKKFFFPPVFRSRIRMLCASWIRICNLCERIRIQILPSTSNKKI
jgi:hypothetical protein